MKVAVRLLAIRRRGMQGEARLDPFEGMAGAENFLPDGISMAKSLGGGFPIGAFWVRAPFADVLGAGTHGTTFGGTPLGCAVALKILEVIERDKLADNARVLGGWLKAELERLAGAYPHVVRNVRGLGFMLGFELMEKIPAFANSDKSAAMQLVNRLHDAGLLTIPVAALEALVNSTVTSIDQIRGSL